MPAALTMARRREDDRRRKTILGGRAMAEAALATPFRTVLANGGMPAALTMARTRRDPANQRACVTRSRTANAPRETTAALNTRKECAMRLGRGNAPGGTRAASPTHSSDSSVCNQSVPHELQLLYIII